MSRVRIMHFSKDRLKLIQIHQYSFIHANHLNIPTGFKSQLHLKTPAVHFPSTRVTYQTESRGVYYQFGPLPMDMEFFQSQEQRTTNTQCLHVFGDLMIDKQLIGSLGLKIFPVSQGAKFEIAL